MVSGTLVAYVAGAGHIIRVEFRVADVVEDVYGECAEAGSTLFLNLKVGACFRGPVDEEFPDGAEASGAFVASDQPHCDRSQPEIGNRLDGGEFSREVRSSDRGGEDRFVCACVFLPFWFGCARDCDGDWPGGSARVR